MEDQQIVALYWRRDEQAIAETDAKYGAFCRGVARNLLGAREDAEECVNDTYLAAWNAMPTARPAKLMAWLGRVVRNISVDRWRKNRAAKRYDGIELLLSELDDCVPAPAAVEERIEAAALGSIIDGWLRALPEADRTLFLRRYWNGEPLKALAEEFQTAPGKLAQKMFRLRRSLRDALEQEGITL